MTTQSQSDFAEGWSADQPLVSVRDLTLWYGKAKALKSVSFDLAQGEILAFIGPSGCGKTTALKCLNRMHDGTRGVRIQGSIRFRGQEAHGHDIDPPLYRRHFGWVAQKPNPFPWSVRQNVLYGAEIHGIAIGQEEEEALLERCLRAANLWDELKDRLETPGTALSGGQQQRLCIARALATEPDVMLMDEPCGSVDPIATAHIEALMRTLRERVSIIVITHSMAQARRVSDRVAFFKLGEILEQGPTAQIFDAPKHPETAAFLAGKFG